ncbi:hypothetical protein DYBT9275_02417 [Dyadobacter sp. CECT 9275]|uniref:Alpha-galactosidase n=1 Tax=Dyadobacter helix TaxID=2822344 RepID=A0A916N5W3_9BACT|nr:alpha-galactosidase [Dyadobacter sp. CECT 9275]CAG5000217.1 hypothetical protein DYBT9275_02417 [Dyadobacter sp. CECT 9275]
MIGSFALLLLAGILQVYGQNQNLHNISIEKNVITIQSGSLQRVIRISKSDIMTESIKVNNKPITSVGSVELALSFHQATPNQAPEGITDTARYEISQEARKANATDVLKILKGGEEVKQNVSWAKICDLKSADWSKVFSHVSSTVSEPAKGTKRLNIRVRSVENNPLNNVSVNLFYEVYQGHPAIRKWVEINNNSGQWLKIDGLTLDGAVLSEAFAHLTKLTPSERGATSSIISFGNSDHSAGVIVGSEVPSALRLIGDKGATGYASEHFEWVIGPAEKFTSEPVFIYAYDQENVKTISAVSTALDRTVERSFKQYLYEVIGLKRTNMAAFVPQWCSWSNFSSYITHENITEMADIAAKAGFRSLLLDAGWAISDKPGAWATSSTVPDPKKFPDFTKTSSHITGKGLQLGLWVSCYRNPAMAADFKNVENAFSIPLIKREGGLAMSFASAWRHYYANDIAYLRDRYGATYFKQDLTNIKFGDIAKGHESRTQKESLLRGLRALLATMDEINASSPDIVMEITHEIYWGTPGVPCDLAALKHVYAYHIPPNDYSGAGKTSQRYSSSWSYKPDSLRAKLISGCFNARKQLYAHRGLPLHSIEYYAAATVNHKGSLTTEVQQRQICSWLMGSPSVFAGDLASLSDENIRTYKDGFSLLEGLDKKYAIYENFQFSGVPAPTDTDWHWWGKLNDQGYGAVVVLRGDSGSPTRKINIPWVQTDTRYNISLGFSKKSLGAFSGRDLRKGVLEIELGTFGQEIIVIEPVNK